MSENDELYHHGVKGQKWGERNGPPYPLESNVSKSKAKRKFDTGKIAEKAKSAANSIRKSVKNAADSAKEKAAERKEKSDAEKERKKEVEEQSSAKKKDPSKMTNDELKEAISRMNLEKMYNSTYNSLHPQTVSKGKQFMSNLGSSLGNAATESVKTVAKDWMTKTLKKSLGLSDDDDTKKEAEKLKNEFQVKNYQDKINDLDTKAATREKTSQADEIAKAVSTKGSQQANNPSNYTIETVSSPKVSKSDYSGITSANDSTKGTRYTANLSKSERAEVDAIRKSSSNTSMSSITSTTLSNGQDFVIESWDYWNKKK